MLESVHCLYGNNIIDTTTPTQVGLTRPIGILRREMKDFPGAELILKILKDKHLKKRFGLKLLNNSGPSARQHRKFKYARSRIHRKNNKWLSKSIIETKVCYGLYSELYIYLFSELGTEILENFS